MLTCKPAPFSVPNLDDECRVLERFVSNRRLAAKIRAQASPRAREQRRMAAAQMDLPPDRHGCGPAAFFLVVEMALRLAGYGYPTSFFVGPDAKGAYGRTRNSGGGSSRNPWRSGSQSCILPAKADGTVRIFVLGDSAAMGVPDASSPSGESLRPCFASVTRVPVSRSSTRP